jgi:hypothetical protein
VFYILLTRVFPVAQVTVEVAVEDALEIALKLVAEILALLTDALAEVKVIVKGDISTILCLEGKVLELSVFANLLADVLVVSFHCSPLRDCPLTESL